MNYATFAALTSYETPALALAANTTDGDAWLLNETKIFQDGTMGKSGPPSVKKDSQIQKASTLTPTVTTNKRSTSGTVGGAYQSSLKDSQNKVTVANEKTPSIRAKVSWFVTDSSQAAGYRRVFGLLEDSTTTNAYRDDDSQVRL